VAKRTSFLIIEMLVTTRKRVLADVESIIDLADKLAATGYFIDPVMTQVVYLAAGSKIHRAASVVFATTMGGWMW